MSDAPPPASVTRYIYEAKLLPIGEPVRIPVNEAEPRRWETSTFDDKAFEIERTAKTKPEVWVNHNRALRIGQVVMLYVSRREGWWCAEFVLDRDVPNVELEVGQAVSVGLDYLKIGSGEPYLREISIVPRGAVKGAEVTRRVALEPAPVRPTSSPAAVSASNRAAVGEDFDEYRPPVWDELERIVGYRITDENFVRAMAEAHRRQIEKLHDEVMASRQVEPEVIVRHGIGQVLGVR
jgi:hypothetical protein